MKSLNIADRIDDQYKARKEQEARSYIGASIIGDPCDAMIQYSLRGFDQIKPEARLQRVFDLGHLVERIVIKDLRAAGVQLFEVDALTGKQHHFSQYGGHVACNLDSQIFENDEVLVGEVKSMNKDQFAKFKNQGVRSSHPKYYDQMLMCMGLSGLRKAVLIAYCKDSSEYHDEIVEFDQMHWDAMVMRINQILGGARERIGRDETDWRCRKCWRNDICWGHRQPSEREKSRCQSCMYSRPTEDGGWHCDRHGRPCDRVCADFVLLMPKERQ